jgi:hypothetical protein
MAEQEAGTTGFSVRSRRAFDSVGAATPAKEEPLNDAAPRPLFVQLGSVDRAPETLAIKPKQNSGPDGLR